MSEIPATDSHGRSSLKIAVIGHSFPRFPGDTHGPFVKRLSEEIAELGHEVHVLVPYDPELKDDPHTPLKIRSFRYVWPPGWHLLGYSRTLRRDIGMRVWGYVLSPLFFIFAIRALKRMVREEGIDIVHAHWILPNGFVARMVQRATGVPYAITLHGSCVFMAEKNLLFRWMGAKALEGASHVTSCSADLKKRLNKLGGGRQGGKIKLVPNGTDCMGNASAQDVAASRQRLGVGDEERLIVAVGRLVDKKGFRYLLEAGPMILSKHPNARIVIGGGGDLLEPLKALAVDLGIDNQVVFTGHLSHHEVLDLIACADIFTMPSVRDDAGNIDGLPIVVLEAMAAGKPVVATDVSGMTLALEHEVNGILVPEKDPEALAQGLVRVLNDHFLAETMGKAGRQRIQTELNWASVARLHDSLYREALHTS